MGRFWSALTICLIFLGLPEHGFAREVPSGVGRWKLVNGDGFCWLSAKAQSGSTVQIVLTPDFMDDQIWLLDGDRAEGIVQKDSTSAVIIDDVAMRADASGSFEPARILKIRDSRLREALRTGRSMRLLIDGRTRAELSLSGSSDALDALSPCLRNLAGSLRGDDVQKPSRLLPVENAEIRPKQLGQAIPCNGFYAYLDMTDGQPLGLSIEITAKSINVRFSDNGSVFGRPIPQPDQSVKFNEGRGDPMWILSCFSDGAFLQQPEDQWSGPRTYILERTDVDIFDFAAKKGVDLSH